MGQGNQGGAIRVHGKTKWRERASRRVNRLRCLRGDGAIFERDDVHGAGIGIVLERDEQTVLAGRADLSRGAVGWNRAVRQDQTGRAIETVHVSVTHGNESTVVVPATHM